jgi:hypothetical protein
MSKLSPFTNGGLDKIKKCGGWVRRKTDPVKKKRGFFL